MLRAAQDTFCPPLSLKLACQEKVATVRNDKKRGSSLCTIRFEEPVQRRLESMETPDTSPVPAVETDEIPDVNELARSVEELKREAKKTDGFPEPPEVEYKILVRRLWDRPEKAFDKSKLTRASGLHLMGFMQKLLRIEEHYSKELTALSEQYLTDSSTDFSSAQTHISQSPMLRQTSSIHVLPKPGDRDFLIKAPRRSVMNILGDKAKFAEGGSLMAGWHALLAQTQDRGLQVKVYADRIGAALKDGQLIECDKLLQEPAMRFTRDAAQGEKKLKKCEAEVAKQTKKLQSFIAATSKKMKKDNDKEANLEAFRAALSAKKQNQLKALELSVEKATLLCDQAREEYHTTIKQTLNAFEALEYKRHATLARKLTELCEGAGHCSSNQYKRSLQAIRVMRSIDKSKDLKEYVSAVESGKECPWLAPAPAPPPLSPNPTQLSSSDRHMASKAVLKWRKAKETNENADGTMSNKMKTRKVRTDLSGPGKEIHYEVEEAKAPPAAQQETKATASEQPAQKQEEITATAVIPDLQQYASPSQEKQLSKTAWATPAPTPDKPEHEINIDPIPETEGHSQAEADTSIVEDDTTKGTAVNSSYVATSDEEEVNLRTPIVFDNGSAYFKAGFAGTTHPALCVPSVVAQYPQLGRTWDPSLGAQSSLVGAAAQHLSFGLSLERQNEMRLNSAVWSDQPQNWEDVEAVWTYLYDRLGADPKEHPILLTQPCLAPVRLQKEMTEIMFEKFDVPCLYVATAPLLAAYAYGAVSGLVVDIGHSSAQVC
eukprot:g64561.t1